MEPSIAPRIYVACLAANNNGYLHGAWIEATHDEWAMWDGIKRILASSPVAGAEEYAIHDYEGFGGVRIEEYTSMSRVAQIAVMLAEHGAMGAALIEHFGGDLNEAREALEDRYLGEHPSLADYVQEVTEDVTPIPSALRYYIDWQAMARDAELNGDVFGVPSAVGGVHVFATREHSANEVARGRSRFVRYLPQFRKKLQ